MDFRVDEEQVALRDAVRAFCQGNFDLAEIAAREGRPTEAPRWNELANLGVFGLMVPAASGGFGVGAAEAAIVFEELGAHLVPGPVLWSTIAAEFVADAVTGTVRVTGVPASPVSGEPVVIEHVAESGVVLVLHDDRVERVATADLAGPIPGESFDPLTPATAYRDLPGGEVIGGSEAAHRLRTLGTVLTAAQLVGVARGALDVASSYALERRQFGVPIGSFQAIKHLLADMFVRVELARSATYAAAVIFDDDRAGDVSRASSSAKLLAGDAGITNARAAVQVLGGMGFTWEMLPHYFLKRAWVLEQAFGSGSKHARALSDALESEVRPG